VNDARQGFALPRPGAGAPLQPPDPASIVPESLPDGAFVDLASERSAAGVDAVLDALDSELVGLVPVKTRIGEIAALLLVDQVRARFGLAAGPPSLHMCFTGNPGTGKTTVALKTAQILHRLGAEVVGCERVRLVDEQHATERRLDDLVGLERGLADVARHKL